MSATRNSLLALSAVAVLLIAGCSAPNDPAPKFTPRPGYSPSPVHTYSPAPVTPAPIVTPAPPADIVITFYGSDIQVLGSTYDDTPAVEDRGRVADGYQIVIPPNTGFYWGVASWNGVADSGCRVTRADEVLLDNTGPDQLSASCINYDGF